MRSSIRGVLNGSFMTPEATSREKVQIGRIHCSTTNRIVFPEERKVASVVVPIHSPVSRSFFSMSPSNLPPVTGKSPSNIVFLLCSSKSLESASRKEPAPMARSIWTIEGGGCGFCCRKRCLFFLGRVAVLGFEFVWVSCGEGLSVREAMGGWITALAMAMDIQLQDKQAMLFLFSSLFFYVLCFVFGFLLFIIYGVLLR